MRRNSVPYNYFRWSDDSTDFDKEVFLGKKKVKMDVEDMNFLNSRSTQELKLKRLMLKKYLSRKRPEGHDEDSLGGLNAFYQELMDREERQRRCREGGAHGKDPSKRALAGGGQSRLKQFADARKINDEAPSRMPRTDSALDLPLKASPGHHKKKPAQRPIDQAAKLKEGQQPCIINE